MPNRILKESICTSETLKDLSWFEEVVWMHLIVCCDDYGRFDGRAAILKSRLFPLKANLTEKQIMLAIDKLASKGLVAMYTYDDRPYLYIPSWDKHQTVRSKTSKYPDPASCKQMNADASKCKQTQADAPVFVFDNTDSIKEIPTNVGTKKSRAFQPPTLEQVKARCAEKGYTLDPEAFMSYYNANGWKVGRTKMVSWIDALAGWESREKQYRKPAKQNAALKYEQKPISKSDFDALVVNLDEVQND